MNAFDRNTNLKIINELRNSEKISLDNYIEKVLMPLCEENLSFSETLYKDIVYILDGIDEDGDNDLVIENGDFVIEDGDFKLTGYQTRLHDLCNWLHIAVIKKISEQSNNPLEIIDKINDFNNKFLTSHNYTPEYRKELENIKKSLKLERDFNHKGHKITLKRFLDPDMLELKPNIFGIGINLNTIIKKFIRRK